MNKDHLLKAIKKLALHPADYIVIGSGILCVLGIRDVSDVDLVVSEEIFRRYEKTGEWRRKEFDDHDTYYLVKGDYDVGLDWGSKDGTPNLADLKQDQVLVDGIPFVSLETLKRWKYLKGTPKHIADIDLIDDYLKNKKL